ncbi:24-dihydroxyhept-2-ene-17-dioic acid aldolase protein [Salinisphaera shabanensis E1L3A]|uniref:24-dihydroxyhept-2-ene-17-dioic acid aldolase protein n=1 Tax=Salinisphaera shabanensis E1L3A TaxID=1033802 RepID=U2E3Z1_9GAMM|nr:HpcH/HpaI aldolase/citrate lyase family protein [Salinisphaera shabanensis]ERJ18551.1 24-dihydroxyhept-2-ene-17-dioic acid aldolase protein [Salinisphaera shabanensis E1L3A]
MTVPINTFKQRLTQGDAQIGLWVACGDPTVAEICSHTGFDWLVIDGEHGPNGLRDVLAQLRAMGDTRSQPVVRVKDDDRATIKQMLDIGAQTLLVPMIESAEQARAAVASVTYPPAGKRGIGAALARASGYNTYTDYLDEADAQICLLLQIESQAGLAALDDILAVDGVDGVFIGPADLAADMGHRGNPTHADVRQAVEDAVNRIVAAGKPAGMLSSNHDFSSRCLELGATFVAVGSDVGLLVNSARQLRATYKND